MLGLVGEQGSEQKCSGQLQGFTAVNKNLFLSTLIVGPCLKAPRGRPLFAQLVLHGHMHRNLPGGRCIPFFRQHLHRLQSSSCIVCLDEK